MDSKAYLIQQEGFKYLSNIIIILFKRCVIKTRLVITFYNLFAFVSLMITLLCQWVNYTYGIGVFTILFGFKIITLGMIFYYIQHFKSDVFYYYKNLGLTKKHLWISTITFDLIIFIMLTILTLKIR